MQRTSLILALSLSIVAIQGAYAQPFVCGQSMVETGMGTTKEQVLAMCGPPSVKGENQWTYKNQPGQVTVVLTFENNQLQQI